MFGPLGGKKALQDFFGGRASLPAPVLARVPGRVWFPPGRNELEAEGHRIGVVTKEGRFVWHRIRKRSIEVMNGAWVEAGTPLTSGAFSALALPKVLSNALAMRPLVEQLLRSPDLLGGPGA